MDMMLLSLLRVQDNYIPPKWCEETAGAFLLSRGWQTAHTNYHLNPCAAISIMGEGTRLDIIVYMLMGSHACFT